MKKWSTKMIVEAGIMLALAIVLSRIKVYEAPMGGSVTAGSMIPILLFAMRWGVGPGIITGATFGILKLVLGGSIYTPIQAILEYPVAFGLLGLAGIFANIKKDSTKGEYYFRTISAIFVAIIGRFVCHFTAGMVFFSKYADDTNPWIYSLLYQSTYLVPEFIVSAVIIFIIWSPLSKALNQ